MSDRIMRGALLGAVGVPSASGWIDRDIIFVKYLHHFVQHAKLSASSRVLIVFDGHAGHKSLEATRYAKEHVTTLLTVPPHTSHCLQPLDATFFDPLKQNYHKEIDRWMLSYPGQRVSVFDISALLGAAYMYLKTACAEEAVNGFLATGF